ncbi:MAG TPA: RodZ domain-containing protein [Herbaspirillum sp.]|nr:RodZ domain-containing protein [Herbaspirillum sp.]
MSDQQHIPGTPSSNDALGSQTEAMQAPTPIPLPGAVLAAARQARGWSVEYVASHLKLATRQIHALEEDRYGALPSPVVIRGFIRIYAKMLGIDSTALVAALPVDTAPPDAQIRPSRTLSTPFSESSLPLRGQHELPIAQLAWLAFGVLVIAGLFAAMKYGNWSDVRNSRLLQRLHISGSAASTPSVATAAPNVDNPDPAAAPAVVADSENAVSSDAVSTVPAATTAPAVPASVTAKAAPATADLPAPMPAPTVPAISPAPAPAVAATPATPVALANPLQLTITQDSWVEIRRADKSIVVSRTMKGGTAESFDINGPMSMTVGNAAGVTATLRGKPLALASTTGNNVARLDLK